MPDGISALLASNQTLTDLRAYTDQVVFYDDFEGAQFLAVEFPKILNANAAVARTYPSLWAQYQDFIDWCKAVRMHTLKDREVLDLLERRAADFLANPDFDLERKLVAKFITITFAEDRDLLKQSMRTALQRNTQRIAQTFAEREGEFTWTAGDWLRLFARTAFATDDEALRREQFLNENSFAKKLPDTEKNVVKRLLKLDQFLQRSSQTPEGFEGSFSVTEDDGRKFLFHGGVVEELKEDEGTNLLDRLLGRTPAAPPRPPAEAPGAAIVPPRDLREKLLQAYLAAQATQGAIYDAEQKLADATGNDPNAVVDALDKAIRGDRGHDTIAALTLLGRMDALPMLIRDPRFQKILEDKVFPLLREALPGIAMPQFIAGVKTEPDRPVWLRELLRHLLTRAANGNTAESARLGALIESLLVESGHDAYLGMTYFREDTGRFEWKVATREDVFRL